MPCDISTLQRNAFIDMTDEEALACWNLEPEQAKVSASASAVIEEPPVAILDGSSLQPIGEQPDSKLDDSEVSELSARFVSSLNLLPLPSQVTPDSALESKVDPADDPMVDPVVEEAERKKFNEGMEVISRFAEDVVKTWFAQMYKRDLKELFPDGLLGHIGSIKMMPSVEMLEARKQMCQQIRESESRLEEESRGDDEAKSVDTSGWELKLVVVDENHRENLMRWREEEPAVLHHMQGLLKTAWGYIQYALESYALPNPELFVEKVIPSPWGTLYVLGAPADSPQIGVRISRCEA